MKDCYLCTKPILWKKVSVGGCNKHFLHTSCCCDFSAVITCPVCVKDEIDLFLQQTTLIDASSSYKTYFDVESLLRKTMSLDNDLLFGFLVKKVKHAHKLLLKCVDDDDFPFFKKIVKHSSINLFLTHNGRTLLEELPISGEKVIYRNEILKKARAPLESTAVVAPPPTNTLYTDISATGPALKPKRAAPPPPPHPPKLRPSAPPIEDQKPPPKLHPSAPPIEDQKPPPKLHPSAPPIEDQKPPPKLRPSAPPIEDQKPPPSYDDAIKTSTYHNIYPNLSVFITLNHGGEMS